ASRAIDWSGAGSSLIDQPRTQCGSTVAAYDGSAAAINNAIASCGGTAASPKYVELGAGTFNLTSGISFAGHSYVTLRGQGANSTFLVFTGAGGGFYNAVISLEPAQLVEWNDTFGEPNNCSWTAGYAKGATVLSLGSCRTGSASNLHVGSIVTLDQLDETADTGQVWNCLNSTVEGGPQCSNNGTGSGGYARNDGATIPCASCTGGVMKYRSQEQGVVVTAVNGNTVTVTPGLYMANWNSAQKPEATFGNTELVGAGLENLSLQAGMPNGIGGTNTSSAGQNIHIGQCRDCWVKGVRSLYANRSHIQVYIATHITIRDSYFYQNISHASVSYGVELNSAFDSLVENNIFQQSTDGEPNCNGACAGNVASYNFDIDNVWGSAGWMQAGFYAHSSGDAFNLWEGNVGPGYTSDDVHGTHHLETIFRNRIIGNQAAGCGSSGPATCSAQTVPLNLYAGSRYYNVIGNVLGQAGYHNVYSANCTTDDSCFNTVTAIYRLGQTGAGGASGFCTTPSCTGHGNYDPQVSAYLMRWGNWDTVHSTVQWNPSEVPASLPLYANAVPASQFLPPSFFRTSAPSWWPAGKPWPPIGPDISGGTMSGSAGHANTIPAEDCFTNVMNGPADGSGGFLNFDAGTCYGGGGGGGPTPTPTPAPTPDVTAPVVSITAPVNSSTISGTISLAANATDNIGVQTVQFQVDGINLGSVLTTPTSGSTYSGSWNTVGVSNGMHTITAVASDAAGNTATALSISVTVNNPIQTPTPTTPPSGGGSSGGGSSGGGGAGGGPINVPSIGIFTPAVPQKPLPATALKSAAASSRLLKSFQFPTTLKTYTTNVNAKNLQIFLNDHRFTVTQSGPGSIGNETTYYGPATIKALAKFQAANGIVPAIGNFGPITRAYVNLMIAAGK
ncbi:MAG: hypothetical protein KGJ33_03160, partial [Patescibacteria group bacterium]|nr:hypothetical protein [Patescibacteria group bacterium]